MFAILNHNGDFGAAARQLATMGYGPPSIVVSVVGAMPDPRLEEQLVTPEPYAFEAAVPSDHFVAQWVAYASRCTDAAYEYHEAAALNLVATCTPTVRARLAQYPNGLGTNAYWLFIGDSTTSRKSTAKDLGRDVLSGCSLAAYARMRSRPRGVRGTVGGAATAEHLSLRG